MTEEENSNKEELPPEDENLLPEGVYTIQQKKNNRYLDAYDEGKRNYSVVTMDKQDNDTQRWIIEQLIP